VLRRLHALYVNEPRETSASEARGIVLPVCTDWTIAIVWYLCGAHIRCAVGLAAECGELGTRFASVIGDSSQYRPVWFSCCFVCIYKFIVCRTLCFESLVVFVKEMGRAGKQGAEGR
jgi:hypothetical protein